MKITVSIDYGSSLSYVAGFNLYIYMIDENFIQSGDIFEAFSYKLLRILLHTLQKKNVKRNTITWEH